MGRNIDLPPLAYSRFGLWPIQIFAKSGNDFSLFDERGESTKL